MALQRLISSISIITIGLSFVLTPRPQTQTDSSPWTMPVNLSQSGAASQPTLAIAPDGTRHVVWWDTTEGEQYVQVPLSGSPTKPIGVPAIVGARQADQRTGRDVLTPPRQVQLITNANGKVFAFWYNSLDQLQVAFTSNDAKWSTATTLTEAAAVIDISADVSGTLRLGYVKTIGDLKAPVGIYYQSNDNTGWSAPVLVYSSAYFRAARPGDLHVSVTGNAQGRVLMAWDDPQTNKATYVRSLDNGRTWEQPQSIPMAASQTLKRVRLIESPDQSVLMLWQDSAGNGCGYNQRRSTNDGQSWTAPERVLSSSSACPEQIKFYTGLDQRLWLVGSSPAKGATTNTAMVAAMTNTGWSKLVEIELSFIQASTQSTARLGCLDLAVGGQMAGLIGCDATGDVWAAQNAVDLARLVTALTPVWQPIEYLSSQPNAIATDELPALMTDQTGNEYVMWTQRSDTGQRSTLLAAIQTEGRWSNAASVLNATPGDITTMRQPALTINTQGRVHAVWSGGLDGEITYSNALLRDFTSARGWSQPIGLPSPLGAESSWPDVEADPRDGTLYVMSAVAFNEHRGIYLTHSNNNGESWSSPVTVFDAAAANWPSVSKPRLAFDTGLNMLHAVWLKSPLPGGTKTQALYYARSVDNGQSWSTPIQLAEGNIDWPQLKASEAGQLHLVWIETLTQANSVAPWRGWELISTSAGQQWTEPAALAEFDQVSGPISLTADNAGRLFMAAIGQDAGNESVVLYTSWQGRSWGKRDTLHLGQIATAGNAAVIAASAETGKLALVLRLATWQTDGTVTFTIGVTERQIDRAADASLPAVIPTPALTPVAELTPTAALTPSPTPTPTVIDPTLKPTTSSPVPPIILGGALAALVVIGATVRTIWVRHYR